MQYHKILFILLFIIILFVGCNQKTKECIVGVIETTEQDNKSIISLYNSELEKTKELDFNLGSMGSFYDVPRRFNDKIYVIPKGIGNQKEQTIILEMDLNTGENKKYDLKMQNMNSFSVTEKYIYGVNTWNFISRIGRLDKDTNETKYIDFEDVYIGRLDAFDNNLFAFGVMKDENANVSSFLYIIDTNTFSVIEEIDITSFGISQYGSVIYDGNFYFTNSTKFDSIDYETPSKSLCIYNIKSNTLKGIELENEYPAQILEYKDNLLISHVNLITGEGSSISIYSPKTSEAKLINFNHNVCQIEIYDDFLFVTDGYYLYKYEIKDNEYIFKTKKSIVQQSNKRAFFYVSSFFVDEIIK